MKKTIPVIFLLCALLILLMAFTHWVWKQGVSDIRFRQTSSLKTLQTESSEAATTIDAWHRLLEKVYAFNADLGLLLVRDREGKPLFLRSRLDQGLTRTMIEPTSSQLENDVLTPNTAEIRLPDGQSGTVLVVWTDALLKVHTKRLLLITIVGSVLLILGWILAVLLGPMIHRKRSKTQQAPHEEEVDQMELLSARNKRLAEEIDDLSGMREVSILAGKETNLSGLVRLACETLTTRASASLRWIAIPKNNTIRQPDARIRTISPARFARLEAMLGNGLRHGRGLLIPLASSGKPFALACVRCSPEHDVRATQYMRQFTSPLYGLLLRDLASIDSLTSLYSRRSFDELMAQHASMPSALPLALILADIDHFKEVNDSLGHQTGDHVLAKTASVIKTAAPKTAVCCRYGGEEFAIILPQTALPAAVSIAETMRMEIATAGMLQHRSVTASFGVAIAHTPAESASAALIGRADSALYFSKQHGRNMVSSQGLAPVLRSGEE